MVYPLDRWITGGGAPGAVGSSRRHPPRRLHPMTSAGPPAFPTNRTRPTNRAGDGKPGNGGVGTHPACPGPLVENPPRPGSPAWSDSPDRRPTRKSVWEGKKGEEL